MKGKGEARIEGVGADRCSGVFFWELRECLPGRPLALDR
jgi:hypothetical protein